ncbi:hypothetical protein GGD62_008191 [Bradyrhizobium sp. ERR14]|nr:hypothetical protein [Bradyrhizobium sp. ERR14]
MVDSRFFDSKMRFGYRGKSRVRSFLRIVDTLVGDTHLDYYQNQEAFIHLHPRMPRVHTS